MQEQWIVHVLGPDDVIDQPDELTALREANTLNRAIAESNCEHPDNPFCMAIVTNLILE
jgi:hypothetical protein